MKSSEIMSMVICTLLGVAHGREGLKPLYCLDHIQCSIHILDIDKLIFTVIESSISQVGRVQQNTTH